MSDQNNINIKTLKEYILLVVAIITAIAGIIFLGSKCR